jgi:hypothetical protein
MTGASWIVQASRFSQWTTTMFSWGGRHRVETGGRVVGRAVVDDDDLELVGRQRLVEERRDG